MDTVCLRLGIDEVKGVDFLSIVPQFLSELSQHDYQNGRVYIKGKLGNMDVGVSENGIKVENSLTKYHLGNNLTAIGRTGVEEAIERLSEELHLPIDRAKVTIMHFGKNISLNYEVPLYFNYLGESGRYKRLQQRTALDYSISWRQVSFYDKIAEMKSKKDLIPKFQNDDNVLRIETRYRSRIASHFKVAEVRASDLYSEQFFAKVDQDWYTQYDSINKLKEQFIDMSAIKSKRELQSLGVSALIQSQGGELLALQNVAERQKKGELTKKQAFDLRNEIKRCSQLKIHSSDNSLIVELDQKVKYSLDA